MRENCAWVVSYVRKISTNLPGMREVNVKCDGQAVRMDLVDGGRYKYSVWIIFIIWVDTKQYF